METTQGFRYDLTRLPWLLKLVRSRWPQFLLRAVTLAGFILVILAGLFGSPVGSHNFAIIAVWIGWWTALKLFFIPLGGRSWCSICPIPMPGEWIQQGWLVKPRASMLGLNWRWPKVLRNSWLQVVGFAMIGLFAAVTLTTPLVTAWVFIGLISAATGLALVFERRAFCRYVCPMGGYIGCYAPLAPLELRPRSTLPCASHPQKVCYTGCGAGSGCPWLNYPAALKESTNCGLCFECMRTCPEGNMRLSLRPMTAELDRPSRFRLDEAFLSLMLLGSVMVFAAVFLGPWGWLKEAAFAAGSPAWWVYAAGYLVFTLAMVPLAVAAAQAAGGRPEGAAKPWFLQGFLAASRAYLPLGFFAWAAFTVAFAFGKLAYLWPVLSDPFGWGWDLFGTAGAAWQPYLVDLSPILQGILLLVGLAWSVRQLLRVQGKNFRSALPLALLAGGVTTAMFWLLLG